MDCPALSKEEVTSLVDDLRIKTPGTKAKLILGHIRLGKAIVRRHASKVGDLPELTGVMQLAIVQAVNDFGCDHDNITGYIITIINQHISDYLYALPLVPVKGSTQRMRKAAGKERITVPDVFDVYDANVQQIDFNLQQFEIDELAEKLCICDQEREVVRLRLTGYSDEEIGQQMGLTRWTVWSIRQELQERYRHYEQH